MLDTIYIHAGLPKTGSSCIQDGMQALSRAGLLTRVAYPVVHPELGSGNGASISQVIVYTEATRFSAARLEASVEEMIRANESDAGSLLISAEDFCFATVEGFACLKQDLLRHARSVKMVVVIRPLRDWTYSVYMQLVKAHGLSADYSEAWLDEYSYGLVWAFKHLDAFDVETIVLPYRQSGLLRHFLQHIGEDERLADGIPDVISNRSLSSEELNILRLVNATFKDEALSLRISSELLLARPDIESAGFPAAADEQFQRFAARFEAELAQFDGPVMRQVKPLLFADVGKPRGEAAIDATAGRTHLTEIEAALRIIRDKLDPQVGDAAAYATLARCAGNLEPTTAFFDPIHYLLMHPDVLQAGIDPSDHYLDFGRREGRASALVRKGLK